MLFRRQHSAPRQNERAHEQHDDERGGRRHRPFADAGGNRNQLARIIQRRQRRDQFGGRRKPRSGIALDATRHEGIEGGRNGLIQRANRRHALGCPLLHRVDSLPRRGGGHHARTGEHLVEDQPERVDVRAAVDRGARALLRRHVFERADDSAARRLFARSGNPEIHDQRETVGADHDVRGLQIAVNDAGVVGGSKAAGDLPGDLQSPRNGQLAVAPQDGREVVALDVRHRDVLDAVDLAQIVNPDDVLVRDLPGEEQFLLEPLFGFRRRAAAARVDANHLQCDGNAQLGVPGLVDRAHAADAKHLDDVIPRAERLTNPERPGEHGAAWGGAADRRADGSAHGGTGAHCFSANRCATRRVDRGT